MLFRSEAHFAGGTATLVQPVGIEVAGDEIGNDLCTFVVIAQVQDALEEYEDGESDYMEVMEYLRVAPLLLFTETKKPVEPAPAKPSLH